MRNSTTAAPTAKPGRPMSKPDRRSYNIRMNAVIIDALNDFCAKNPKAGSASDVVERETFRFLRTKKRKYQLNIPEDILRP
jgi:hypothetical protein